MTIEQMWKRYTLAVYGSMDTIPAALEKHLKISFYAGVISTLSEITEISENRSNTEMVKDKLTKLYQEAELFQQINMRGNNGIH